MGEEEVGWRRGKRGMVRRWRGEAGEEKEMEEVEEELVLGGGVVVNHSVQSAWSHKLCGETIRCLPRTCCSKLVITDTACCKTVNFV